MLRRKLAMPKCLDQGYGHCALKVAGAADGTNPGREKRKLAAEVTMRYRRELPACVLVSLGALSLFPLDKLSAQQLRPVPQSQLCVTEGSVEQLPNNQLQVSVPAMRAFLTVLTPQTEEARFTYSGSTGNEKALGSGIIRRQFGLKLHAGDPCNLVYVMWRIDPDKKIVVSVKSNPGQHTSAECGNRGYTNIKPARSSPTPVVNAGESHTLRAEMNGATLRVYADGNLTWQGSVGPDAAALPGPVGIRSDNAALQFQLLAALPNGTASGPAPACTKGAGD
jgi:hypothetical protein